MNKPSMRIPLETLQRVVLEATRAAASAALRAGHEVIGWKNGKLVKLEPSAPAPSFSKGDAAERDAKGK
jgi:hypothetical protein